jgi:signal transduction histidine kinase
MARTRDRAPAATLARLCEALQGAADRERHQLARALHDSAAQSASAASMGLSLVEGEAAALSPSARGSLAEAAAQIAACCRELRGLSHALFPPLLAEAGLAPPLRALQARLGEARLRIELAALPRLPAPRELAAYRLVEEALEGLFDRRAPVHARLEPEGAAGRGLALSLDGRPQRGITAALSLMALRQRVRAHGGRWRVRRGRGRLWLAVAFPARSGRKAGG